MSDLFSLFLYKVNHEFLPSEYIPGSVQKLSVMINTIVRKCMSVQQRLQACLQVKNCF